MTRQHVRAPLAPSGTLAACGERDTPWSSVYISPSVKVARAIVSEYPERVICARCLERLGER